MVSIKYIILLLYLHILLLNDTILYQLYTYILLDKKNYDIYENYKIYFNNNRRSIFYFDISILFR